MNEADAVAGMALGIAEIARGVTTMLVRSGAARPEAVHDTMRDVAGILRRHATGRRSDGAAVLRCIAVMIESDQARLRGLRPS